MISDRDLAQHVADLYASAGAWDAILTPDTVGGICAGLRRIGDDDVIVFRGSVTLIDWCRDFMAIPHLVAAHPQLGDVHAGFMLGLDDAFARLAPLLRRTGTVHVIGHSLGAARATLFAALLSVTNGANDIRRVVWGEPRSSGRQMATLLTPSQWGRSYRNKHSLMIDPVTDVPTDPPFHHVAALTELSVTPADLLPTSLHHFALYQAATPA